MMTGNIAEIELDQIEEQLNEKASSTITDKTMSIMEMDSEGNILSPKSKLEASTYTELDIEEIEIELDFSEMVPFLFPELYNPKSREDAKNKVFELIQKYPKIMTTEILDKIDYDEWELLEILDELKDEGSIE